MREYVTTISNHGGFNINSNLRQQKDIAAVNSNYHNMKIHYDEEINIMLQDLIEKYLKNEETKMVAIKDELIKFLEDESI